MVVATLMLLDMATAGHINELQVFQTMMQKIIWLTQQFWTALKYRYVKCEETILKF